MRRVFYLSILTSIIFGSCTKEIERPGFDEIQGEWMMEEIEIQEYYDGEVQNVIRFTPASYTSISFFSDGVYNPNDPVALYWCTNQANQQGGTYFLENNESQLYFDKGVGELSNLPAELNTIDELNSSHLDFRIDYIDSIITVIDSTTGDRFENYCTDYLAPTISQRHGYHRGLEISELDYNQGFEDGYLNGYLLGYTFGGGLSQRSFYLTYLQNWVFYYNQGKDFTGIDISGSTYETGFNTGQNGGFGDGFTDGQNRVHGIPESVRLNYNNRRP